jgi:hypothetical protein
MENVNDFMYSLMLAHGHLYHPKESTYFFLHGILNKIFLTNYVLPAGQGAHHLSVYCAK